MNRNKDWGHSSTKLSRSIWIGTSLYLLIFAGISIALKSAISYDDAEQVLLSQDWRLGYGDQPPLYTYLTKLVFEPFGPSQIALSLLKVGLLSSCVAGLLLLCKELKFRAEQTVIAISGYAFIPQFIWTSQTSLTHSILSTTIGIFLLLAVIRAEQKPCNANFISIGILVAAGLLSKYSFWVFVSAITATGLSIERYRSTFLSRRIFLSLTTAIGILAPHIHWCLTNAAQSLYGWKDYESMNWPFWAWPISGLAIAIVFLSPYWLCFTILAWPQRRFLQIADGRDNPAQALLQRLPLAMVLAMLIVIELVTQEKIIRAHWFHSLLFFIPLSAATLLPVIEVKKTRMFAFLATITALSTLIALPANIIAKRAIRKNPAKSEIPTKADLKKAIDTITKANKRVDIIIASNIKLAATARLAYPEVRVIALNKGFSASGSHKAHLQSNPSSQGIAGPKTILVLATSGNEQELSNHLKNHFLKNCSPHLEIKFSRPSIVASSGRELGFNYSLIRFDSQKPLKDPGVIGCI